MSDVLVDIRAVRKHFGGVCALRDVSLTIAAGEVHALCGENGAGKSTLIEILGGSCRADAGRITVAGRRLRRGRVGASESAGIAVIHQEPVAFGHLSAVDNLYVGRERTVLGGLLLDRRAMRRRTRELLAELGAEMDVAACVGELPLPQRQLVAIARALLREARLLVLDEPTASLSERETRVLFDRLRALRRRGVSVLYVSHRLEEVFALADRVSVLRDGELVGTRAVGEIDRPGLVAMMVGRDLAEDRRDETTAAPVGETVLEVRGLTRRGAFEDVSFSLQAGEVVGLAGLVGAGRSEVARALAGVDGYDSGRVEIAGRPLGRASVRRAMRRGLVMVPEDRRHQGLILPMSVAANLTLPILRHLTRLGLRRRRRERQVAERQMADLDVRAASPYVPAETLSGGNQQKVVLGKWLAAGPKVLVLDEPTRGVDVAAKARVHRLIRRLAPRGLAMLLISSDLPELLAVCDRILVMRGGRIVAEMPRDQATRQRVLRAALPPQRDPVDRPRHKGAPS